MAKKVHRQLDYFLEGVNEPKPPALADKRTSIALMLTMMASAGCASVATSNISKVQTPTQTPTPTPPKETVRPDEGEENQEDEGSRVEDNSSECDKSKKGKKQKNCPEKADEPRRQKKWYRKLHNPLLDGNDEHKQLKRDEKRKILTQNTRRGSKWLRSA